MSTNPPSRVETDGYSFLSFFVRAVLPGSKYDLWGRVSRYSRMSAAMISLAGSILAVCYAIIWNIMLIIPFGITALAAAYVAHVIKVYNDLESHEKSLEKKIEELTQIETNFKEQLGTLQTSLSDLNQATEKGQQAFSEKLQILDQSCTDLSDIGTTIKAIFEKLTGKEEIAQRIKEIENAQTALSRIQNKYCTVQEQLTAALVRQTELATKNEDLAAQNATLVKNLQELETQYGAGLKQLKDSVDNIGKKTEALQQEREKFSGLITKVSMFVHYFFPQSKLLESSSLKEVVVH